MYMYGLFSNASYKGHLNVYYVDNGHDNVDKQCLQINWTVNRCTLSRNHICAPPRLQLHKKNLATGVHTAGVHPAGVQNRCYTQKGNNEIFFTRVRTIPLKI